MAISFRIHPRSYHHNFILHCVSKSIPLDVW